MPVPVSYEYIPCIVVIPLKHLASLPHQNTLNDDRLTPGVSVDNKAEARSFFLMELLRC